MVEEKNSSSFLRQLLGWHEDVELNCYVSEQSYEDWNEAYALLAVSLPIVKESYYGLSRPAPLPHCHTQSSVIKPSLMCTLPVSVCDVCDVLRSRKAIKNQFPVSYSKTSLMR